MTEGPYKLPEGWRWVRLGEVAKVCYGRANPKRPGNIPVVGSGGIYDYTEAALVSFPTVVIGRKGSAGEAILVKEPCWPSDTTFYLEWLCEVSPDWIAAWLTFRKPSSEGTSATLPSVRREDLELFPIPLPPLAEQRRIVARIEELMARVREARRLRQEAMEDAERLWQSVLADTFPCPGSALPEGWRWVRLGEVCFKPEYGYTASAITEAIGPKFLRITDVTSGEVDWERVPYCRADEKALAKYKLSVGDVLFARSGSVGATIVIREPPPEAVFASYLIRVRLRGEVLPECAEWILKAPVCQLQLLPQGAAQKNINAKHIQQLLIPLPPLAEQRRIVARVEAVWEKLHALKEAQAETDQELGCLEQAILDKAFRGEL